MIVHKLSLGVSRASQLFGITVRLQSTGASPISGLATEEAVSRDASEAGMVEVGGIGGRVTGWTVRL